MQFLFLLPLLMSQACNNHRSERGGSTRRITPMLIQSKLIIHHARGIAEADSLMMLSWHANKISHNLEKTRKRLENAIADTTDHDTVLRLNTEFQSWSLNLKEELPYLAADGSLDTRVDITQVRDRHVASNIMQKLQSIERMLSEPLRGTDKVLEANE